LITSLELERLERAGRRILKHEASASVQVLGELPDAVVCKTYRNRGLRRLQSFARKSRAQREHDHLVAIGTASVPCLEALGWSERRRCACVIESTLTTRFLPDSAPLKRVLQQLPPASNGPIRARLVRAMGHLVAQLHRQGLLWFTPMPRNVLVVGAPAAAQLVVCDTPSCVQAGRPVHGGRLARIDLFLGAFSPSRRRDFSATERMRWLCGYCADDRLAVRRLWRCMCRRRSWQNVIARAMAMAWHTYIVAPFRSRRRSTKTTVR
jgi:hypothetical protein